ncbi:MAG TPA: VWA domain-containing protein [Pyrinomonadaceae bacterium]|nr:VWA domain-containing protein [Pyrinomonadaceae bacterium]
MQIPKKVRALLPALFAFICLAPVAPAQSTTQKTTTTREPFGSSLRRPAQERLPKSSAPESKEEDSLRPEETIKVDTLLVSLDVVVTDEKETRFIAGLKPEDFVIVEDDVPQKLATLTLGDDAARLPRSIVLVFDWSGSQIPYLEASVRAAKTLVDQLAQTDQMAIVTDSVSLITDFTNDKKRLKSSLDALLKQARNGWKGRSKQFSALLATLRELIDAETRRPIVIFQTDGDELHSLQDPPGERSTLPGVYYMSDVFKEVERSRAKIYAVIPGERLFGITEEQLSARRGRVMARLVESWYDFNPRAERPKQMPQVPDNVALLYLGKYAQGQEAAARAAELSGGWAEFLDAPERAEPIYKRILADINSHYILGYYPMNKERDGRLRKVRVEVRNHPEYKVHGRRSYYATR